MCTYFRLAIVAEGQLKRGMYCAGERCDTLELARQLPGNLTRSNPRERLAVVRVHVLPGYWTDSEGMAHERYSDPVVVELVDEQATD